MRQVEFCLQRLCKQGDEIGLSEAGRKGENQPGGQPGGIVAQEVRTAYLADEHGSVFQTSESGQNMDRSDDCRFGSAAGITDGFEGVADFVENCRIINGCRCLEFLIVGNLDHDGSQDFP